MFERGHLVGELLGAPPELGDIGSCSGTRQGSGGQPDQQARRDSAREDPSPFHLLVVGLPDGLIEALAR
jgi:hypothetical protein